MDWEGELHLVFRVPYWDTKAETAGQASSHWAVQNIQDSDTIRCGKALGCSNQMLMCRHIGRKASVTPAPLAPPTAQVTCHLPSLVLHIQNPVSTIPGTCPSPSSTDVGISLYRAHTSHWHLSFLPSKPGI